MAEHTNTYLFLCVSAALSGAASCVFFSLYRSRKETAKEFRHMPISNPDSELKHQLQLQENHYLEYAAVEGVVKELGHTLHSNHGKGEGVVMRSQIVEHRLQLENGFWVETTRLIKDTLNIVPFAIAKDGEDDPGNRVEVTNPRNASRLRDELETTYDWPSVVNRFCQIVRSLIVPDTYVSWKEGEQHILQRTSQQFTPANGLQADVDNALNIFAREFTKGFQITERMLLTGSNILGVGKIILDQGQVKLGPPDDPKRSFILTRMRLHELLLHYQTQAANYKMMAGIAACAGGSLMVYGICRYILNRLQQHQQRQMFDRIRRSLAEQRQRQGHNIEADEAEDETEGAAENVCVVCLMHVSQVINVPCRHFIMCVSCAEALPVPKRCPVCRARIERFIPMYSSELD